MKLKYYGGRIKVRESKKGEEMLMKIKDKGVGIKK